MAITISQDVPSALAFSPQERMMRLAAMTAQQKKFALIFLSGFAPAVFDAVCDAVEPGDGGEDLLA